MHRLGGEGRLRAEKPPLVGRLAETFDFHYNGGEINFSGPPFYAIWAFYHQEVTDMTEQQRELLLKALQEQAVRHAASPAAAMEFLVATGTYTKTGDLAPEFGGPGYTEELE
jgi:hypothetical protein